MSNRPRTGWYVTLSLAVVAAAYVTVAFFPTERAIDRLRAETIERQQFCTRAGNLASILESTKGRLEKAKAFNQRWAEVAPTRPEVSALLGKIDALVRTSGSRITRFDPEPILRRQRVSELPLTVGCLGTFAQVFRFLHDLEDLPQTAWIKSLKLEKAGQTENLVACEANLVIFMDNREISDQADETERPIREKTVRSE